MARCDGFGVPVAVLAVLALLQLQWLSCVVVAQGGTWDVLNSDVGIASMHTAITHYDTAILLDRTNVGPSRILLSNRTGCRNQPLERMSKVDCYAHSVMFNPNGNSVRPLFIYTDTWCSSGQFFADGTMVQTGGDFEGLYKIRRLTPCSAQGLCDWVEDPSNSLTSGRWYSTNQILPDGQRQIIVGGRSAVSYEFVPKRTPTEGTFNLALLYGGKDNLYPYVSLLPDGNLWIFAATDSILLNYNTNVVLRQYPTLPGQTRNYPAAGSSTLLPLSWVDGFQSAEVLICGGSSASFNTDQPGQKSCGRMMVTSPNATWLMEDMPVARVMGDMTILPTGDVLIINGAQVGSQGWGAASVPAFQPCLYATNDPTNRFTLLAATTIARVYHSTANLMSDGRILVAGSNTHEFYTYNNTAFPTELRVEAFNPPYLSNINRNQRPMVVDWPNQMSYGRVYMVSYFGGGGGGRRYRGDRGDRGDQGDRGASVTVQCNLHSAPFVTHSYAMGQRQLKLQTTPMPGWGFAPLRRLFVTAPPNGNVAPAQYYLLFVLHNGIPGKAKWVQVSA